MTGNLLRCAVTSFITLSTLQLAHADDVFRTNVQASASDTTKTLACTAAFEQADDEAFTQIEEHFDSLDSYNDENNNEYIIRIVEQNEDVSLRDDYQSVCVFSGTWEASIVSLDQPEQASQTRQAPTLIGSEQYIDGIYNSRCSDRRKTDLCWQGIARQASEDLNRDLSTTHNMRNLELVYIDFEGRQRDQLRQGRLEITADGRFYFKVIERTRPNTNGTMNIRRKNEPAHPVTSPSRPTTRSHTPTKPTDGLRDKLDVTLYATWDANDLADTNDLAISSERFGIGLWANNRIGFLAFYGNDEFGIGNDDQIVQNDGDSYNTFGIGLGARAFDSRSFNIESALYYVDAQPYERLIDPDDCTDCARTVTADDYVQATVNFKTNSKGLNIGWMFTWKYLENEANFNNLSSGIYLELMF